MTRRKGVKPAEDTCLKALLDSEASLITIVGDWAKVKDQLAAYKEITFVDLDGRSIAAPQ